MDYKEFNKNISFSYGENPCIHIKDSYLIQSKEDIKSMLEYIRSLSGYKQLQRDGYTRTFESEYREWKAHNFLYNIGFQRKRTGTVDIDQNEPKLCRFIYAILSIF